MTCTLNKSFYHIYHVSLLVTMHISDDTHKLLQTGLIAGSAALGAAVVSKYSGFDVSTTVGLLAIAGGGAVLADTVEKNLEEGWNPTNVIVMDPPGIGSTAARVAAYTLGLYVMGPRGDMEVAIAVGATCAAGQLFSNQINKFLGY